MDVEKIVQLILDFLTTTGTTLAKEGFRIALRYTLVDGFVKLGVAAFAVIILLITLVISWKVLNKMNDNDDPEGVIWIDIVVIFICVITFGFSFFPGIKMVLAPEWYTILNLINLVK